MFAIVSARVLLRVALLFSCSTSITTAFVPLRGARATFSTTNLFVASAESRVDISNLGRGMGGRIEEAFAAAKAKGEAAFVTFVTAGYPKAQGKNFDRVAFAGLLRIQWSD